MLQKSFVFSPYIAARYGITVEPFQIPFLLAKDKVIAQQRALIEFQKRNAQCHALSMYFSYRPFLLPNRPVHHLRRTRMGLIVSVDYEWGFGDSTTATTSCGLEHVRTWTGYYRSARDFEKPNHLQQAELDEAGMTIAQAQGIDPTTSQDPLELQVFTNIMAGESTPLSARVGWGTDGEAIMAPATGVYLLDPRKIQKEEKTSVVTAHEPTKEDAAAQVTAVEEEEEPATQKFAFNPLATMFATSPFGPRVLNGRPGQHNGLDLRARLETDLFAVDEGVITFSAYDTANPKNGYRISMTTKAGHQVTMIHCSTTSEGVVRAGQQVRAGDHIGYTGATGQGNRAPHLHIQVRDATKGNAAVDPVPFFPGPTGGSTRPRNQRTT